jgi:hypothetical protein
MTCRIDSRRGAAPPERTVRARVAPAGPLEPAVERPKRIDAYIDYFASGYRRRAGIASDPRGEARLGGDAC